MRRLAAIVCALAAGAVAQPAMPQNTPRVSQPTLIEKHEPKYSEEARTARLSGAVSVEIVVGAEGVPRALRVRKSLGLGLDEEAIAAVRTWRFGPGMREGVPVPVIARVDVNFRLFDTPMIVWHLEAVNFDAPVGASRPEVIRSAFPKEVQGEDASVSVSFDITEKGEPTNLTLVNAAFLNSEATVLESVTQWRFKPATKDGTPVPVRATFNFVHHGR